MIAAAAVQKPKALRRGSRFAVIAPASPGQPDRVASGQKELERVGFSAALQDHLQADRYFASSAMARRSELLIALTNFATHALIAARGGSGSVYLLHR